MPSSSTMTAGSRALLAGAPTVRRSASPAGWRDQAFDLALRDGHRMRGGLSGSLAGILTWIDTGRLEAASCNTRSPLSGLGVTHAGIFGGESDRLRRWRPQGCRLCGVRAVSYTHL